MTSAPSIAGHQDPSLNDHVFSEIATSARALAGLKIPENKRSLVQSRLSRRLRALGLSSFEDYLKVLHEKDAGSEREHFISALTTNVTHFFREPHHFTALETECLPALLDRAREGGRVRLWSAGCSSGQEAYCLASIINRLEPEAGSMDIRILATDIDRAVLKTAQSGAYPDHLASGLTKQQTDALFAPSASDGTLTVRSELRSMVTFKELNLIAPWPIKRPFDVIFCRNVVIYFDASTQNALWQKFVSVLAPRGRMFLGHSERITEPSKYGLEPCGLTAYRPAALDHAQPPRAQTGST
ncbi:MAG: protein-glutamate O-methyltransferase CheR [Rhodobacteraceae bacterium]|nr:protein-glutamate O-methyltransferase CheR [Paracoccaceae bacterium]